MEAIKENKKGIGDAKLGSWSALFASLLPLWLFSFVVMAEGFPKPPLSINLAIGGVFLAIAVSIVLLWRMPFEVLLYSFFPFILLLTFDKISTSYKRPFILLCALILSAGILSYDHALSRSVRLAWLVLQLVFIATWVLASHASQNYWKMVGALHFPVDCMPYSQGCALLAGREREGGCHASDHK